MLKHLRSKWIEFPATPALLPLRAVSFHPWELMVLWANLILFLDFCLNIYNIHILFLKWLVADIDPFQTERPVIFSLKGVGDATANFDEKRKIGEGGYGSVYLGVIGTHVRSYCSVWCKILQSCGGKNLMCDHCCRKLQLKRWKQANQRSSLRS